MLRMLKMGKNGESNISLEKFNQTLREGSFESYIPKIDINKAPKLAKTRDNSVSTLNDYYSDDLNTHKSSERYQN